MAFFSNLFQPKSSSVLGVDLGSSVVKVVELSPQGSQFQLDNYVMAKLDLGKETQRNVKELTDVLKEALAQAKFKSKSAYVAVPEASSFSTLIELPVIPEKELALAIPYEAKKYIPISIDQIYLQWIVLPQANSSTNGASLARKGMPEIQPPSPKLQVLLVAVMKDVVENLTQVAVSAGLKVLGLETESFSLMRALLGNTQDVIMLVDIGTHSFNINVVEGGFLHFGYEQEFAILRDRDKVEFQKSINDGITKEIQRTSNLYFNKSGKKIVKCIFVGGGSFVAGLLPYVKETLNIDVLQGNPFSDIVYSPTLKSVIEEIGPSMSVAIGLAKRQTT